MTNFARPYSGTSYQLQWEKEYQKLLFEFLKGHQTFDGSEICAWMRRKGLGDPVHHNYWGYQVQYYAAQGLFHKVGTCMPLGTQAHIEQVSLWKKGPKP